MNPKIYKPEERVPQEIIDRIRENEECFEQILSNGSEGFVGDVGTLPHFSTFSRLFLHRSISLIYCFLPLLKLAYTFTQYQFSAPLFAPPFYKWLILSKGCGKRGIRTLGTRKSTTVFETVPIDHSGIFPCGSYCYCKITNYFLYLVFFS